jgi:hypothetical protein
MGKVVLGGKRGRAAFRVRMMDGAKEPIACNHAKVTGSFLFLPSLFFGHIYFLCTASVSFPLPPLTVPSFFFTWMSCLVEDLR